MLGIFDSGFGGLNVLQSVRAALPELDIMYLGDSARTPYGTRSRDTVTKYTKECCSYLFDQGCSLIVLACNTASADTLRELQQKWLPAEGQRTKDPSTKLRTGFGPRNIIGVIRPLAEEAAELTRNGCIGVVGTRSTVDSGTYIEELKKLKADVRVVQQACPLLVPLVEEGWEKKPESRKILRTYLQPVKSANPDVLILGCTHYEALHSLFAKMMGNRCTVLHSPTIIAEKLSDFIKRHPEYEIGRTGQTRFLTTGDPAHFAEIGARFYGSTALTAEKVEVSLAKESIPC